MQLSKLNGTVLYEMLRGGLEALEENRAAVDVLNVFPVPDGDTGTNMVLTLRSAVKEMEKSGSFNLSDLSQAASSGSLMGARGNSGVILSQILRGLAKGLQGMEEANALEFAQALQLGVKTAYKAVMKPVEGTILTVAREAADGALAVADKTDNISDVLDTFLLQGEEALVHTPDLLPVLKRAGVVDAGGKGYMFIWAGARDALYRLEDRKAQLPLLHTNGEKKLTLETINSIEQLIDSDGITANKLSKPTGSAFNPEMEIKFQYCTEAIVKGPLLPLETMRQVLASLGDSLMVVGTEQLAKVHVHTNHPGLVLETCLEYGSLHRLKIDNMQEQHQEHSISALVAEKEIASGFIPAPIPKNIGLVTVATGSGIVEILGSLGVDQVVQGGQSMNPSIEDLVQAVNLIDAPQVVILPNNSNIILAAEQVAGMLTKEVRVVPTRSLAQTIGALVAFDPEASLENNLKVMLAGSSRVKSGEVTYAVRDCHMDGLDISSNQILGIVEGDIKTVGEEVSAVVINLLKIMVGEENELISLFYGEEVEADQAEGLADEIRGIFSNCEVELHQGGQPLYYYFISVE